MAFQKEYLSKQILQSFIESGRKSFIEKIYTLLLLTILIHGGMHVAYPLIVESVSWLETGVFALRPFIDFWPSLTTELELHWGIPITWYGLRELLDIIPVDLLLFIALKFVERMLDRV